MKKFKVSNSKIKTWRSCKLKYHYKYIEKLKPRRKAPPLVRGTVIHNMLEAQIKGSDPWKVFRKAKRTYKHMFREERAEYDEMMDDIRRLMEGYFIHYENDPIDYIEHKGKFSEYYFEVELTPSIVLIGYIDSSGYKDDLTWLVEHKSHKQLPEGDLKYSDIQGALYAWVMPRIGLPEPDGVCWDYIRAKGPTIPEVLKSGELTQKKSIDTIWPTYLETIKEHGLDENNYRDMKKQLENKYSDFYVRKYLPLNKNIVENLLDEAITTAREIKRKAGRDKTRNIDKHCQWCDYYNLCQAELRGLDSDFIRKNNFEVRDENNQTKK